MVQRQLLQRVAVAKQCHHWIDSPSRQGEHPVLLLVKHHGFHHFAVKPCFAVADDAQRQLAILHRGGDKATAVVRVYLVESVSNQLINSDCGFVVFDCHCSHRHALLRLSVSRCSALLRALRASSDVVELSVAALVAHGAFTVLSDLLRSDVHYFVFHSSNLFVLVCRVNNTVVSLRAILGGTDKVVLFDCEFKSAVDEV